MQSFVTVANLNRHVQTWPVTIKAIIVLLLFIYLSKRTLFNIRLHVDNFYKSSPSLSCRFLMIEDREFGHGL